MFHVSWDSENNGVLLSIENGEQSLSVVPRPVFYEELDMLGLSSTWSYPKSKEPLCWACGRRYYYNGECIMDVEGGNLYDAPKVKIKPDAVGLALLPINIAEVCEKNSTLLDYLESEAMRFIFEQFQASSKRKLNDARNPEIDWIRLREVEESIEKKPMALVQQSCGSFDIVSLDDALASGRRILRSHKVDEVVVSFSGGKDSQVVLDLATRVLAPDSYKVVYGDTGYELPSSLSLYEQVEEYYTERYPALEFDMTRNHQDIMHYWKTMGAPSRMHRWCCAVMKTAPLYRYLKTSAGLDKQPKVLVFEGVRAEESARRAEYVRVGASVKHNGVLNARPIFYWNSTEIYLYILRYNLLLNESYRKGLSRVGCALCPYSTGWSEHIVMKEYPNTLKPFISYLESLCNSIGVKDVNTYIKEGKWKMRGGGKVLLDEESRLELLASGKDVVVLLTSPKEDFFEWLKVIGPYSAHADGNVIEGEIIRKVKGTTYKLRYKYELLSGTKYKITFYGLGGNPELKSLVLKVLNKVVYCVHCEACEVECPTGALEVTPTVTIDSSKCVHCAKCVTFKDKGCMMAKSVAESFTSVVSKKMNLDRYNSFGLQSNWLDDFLSNCDNYFEIENGLHPKKQVPALRNWLREARLLSLSDSTPSELTEIIIKNRVFPNNMELLWELIWTNLAVASPICSLFVQLVEFGCPISKKEIINKIVERDNSLSERTVKNAVDAFVNLIVKSPLHEFLFNVEMKGRVVTSIERIKYVPNVATLGYALFSYAERHGSKMLTMRELTADDSKDNIRTLFGFGEKDLESLVRLLQNRFGVLEVQLSMGLDNVVLKDDIDSAYVINYLSERL